MTQETRDASVDRLYRLLAEALQQSRGDFDAPVTVAEIYQELVPYRVVRSEAGFGMNADYEHALLRLLAGEAGRVRLEPETARETILRELRGANPNVGLYRDYAGCDVWVTPPGPALAAASNAVAAADAAIAALSDVLEDDDDDDADDDDGFIFALIEESQEEERGVAVQSAATEPGNASRDDGSGDAAPAVGDAGRDAGAVSAGPAAAEAEPVQRGLEPGRCTYCDSTLPTQRPVRFCPYCGGDQTTRPCDACGEPLEPGWMFCVACGQGRDNVQ